MRLVEEADFGGLQANRHGPEGETPESGASQPQHARASATTSSSSTSVHASTSSAVPSTEPVIDPLEQILDEFPFTANMPKSTPEERARRLEKYNCYPWMHPGYVPSASPEPEPTTPPQPSTTTSETPVDLLADHDTEPVRNVMDTFSLFLLRISFPFLFLYRVPS